MYKHLQHTLSIPKSLKQQLLPLLSMGCGKVQVWGPMAHMKYQLFTDDDNGHVRCPGPTIYCRTYIPGTLEQQALIYWCTP